MAALAADGRLLDVHAMQAAADRLGAPRVADEAALADGPFEPRVLLPVVAGRHAPRLPGGVPGHGRFHQEPLRLDQVGPRVPAGTDDILDGVLAQDHLSRPVGQQQLAVQHLAILADDLITAPRERVVEGAIGGLAPRIDGRHGPPHAGVSEGGVLGPMAGPAGVAADVADVRPGVPVRARRDGRQRERPRFRRSRDRPGPIPAHVHEECRPHDDQHPEREPPSQPMRATPPASDAGRVGEGEFAAESFIAIPPAGRGRGRSWQRDRDGKIASPLATFRDRGTGRGSATKKIPASRPPWGGDFRGKREDRAAASPTSWP